MTSWCYFAHVAISMLSDPRMIDVLGVAMNIDLSGMAGKPDSDASATAAASYDTPAASHPPPASASKPAPESTPEPPAEDIEMTEEEREEAKAKAEAAALKQLGTASYKERKLDEAADYFSQAWELYPKDITLLTNLAAVHFEKAEYDKCIETCEKAVEEGRSVGIRPSPRLSSVHRLRCSTVQTLSSSLKRWAVPALPACKRATLDLRSATSKSRSPSTGTRRFWRSCRLRKERWPMQSDSRTSTLPSLPLHARRATPRSKGATLLGPSSTTQRASSVTRPTHGGTTTERRRT